MDKGRRNSRARRQSKVVRAGLAGSLDAHEEVPWDLVDRYLLPLLAAHASAVVLGTVLNTLRISQISSWTLFFWFIAITLAVLWFYHNLQVSAAGKSVFVTGADNKLGVAIVKQLDDLGFTVFAAMKNPTCDEGYRLKEMCSGRLHLVKLDVTSVEQVQAARQYVQENLPPASNGLWALVNNEQWTAFGEVEWLPWEIFRHSLDVNVLGTIRITQAFLPLIRKAKGRVVCVSSIVGRVTAPLHAPFCASRAAIDAFSDCLRSEMRRWGVDVVTVEPGRYTSGKMWVDDEKLLQNAKLMWEEMPDETRQDYGEFYFEYTVRKALDPFVRGPESDLSPAVRCLTDSVCRTFPLARYTAVTRADKLRALILHHLPRSVHDAIYE